jgi:hypothetical protein
VISVIVPLERDRGQAQRAVRSWGAQQAGAHEVEIIALDAEELGAANIYEIYHRGAELARGEYLLFTEGHCIARPDCLRRLGDELGERPEGFVNLAVADLTSNHISRVDARVDRREWARLVEAGDWRAVSNQGALIARDVYFDLGGFSYEFGGFSWTALALRAARAGLPIGHAKGAVVEHLFREDLREIAEMAANFARGEIAFRSAVDPERWSDLLPEHPVRTHPAAPRERLAAARAVAAAAARCHRRWAPAPALDAALVAFIAAVLEYVWITTDPAGLPGPRAASPWREAVAA